MRETRVVACFRQEQFEMQDQFSSHTMAVVYIGCIKHEQGILNKIKQSGRVYGH